MKLSKYELWSALLYSTEKTEQVTKLMHWLEEHMTTTEEVVIQLVKEEK